MGIARYAIFRCALMLIGSILQVRVAATNRNWMRAMFGFVSVILISDFIIIIHVIATF